MSERATPLVWLVIREDEGGNRYRVGSCPTKDEAERLADSLHGHGPEQLYWVEPLEQSGTP